MTRKVRIGRDTLVNMAYSQHKRVAAYMEPIALALALDDCLRNKAGHVLRELYEAAFQDGLASRDMESSKAIRDSAVADALRALDLE